MDVERLTQHCLAKPGAWLDWPWGGPDADGGHEHPAVKVGPVDGGRIFAFLRGDGVGVKAGATREVADEWLERYPDAAGVMRYIGRSGWNDLAYAGIPDDELLEAVDVSYDLVVARLPRRLRPT
ncbi:MmcQ/YjbR family DNA-binding protein [Nocardioides sp. 1609]|uniref:MmcQ/YjbR family DNA-binding protein n=1 Tax=Nocardioides sp. 1609 TaxID=2508327 RepID=UPI00106F1B3B|nr:MmcQ/YjbR family DNA-binding protein [Nocardioides sp. 1609]